MAPRRRGDGEEMHAAHRDAGRRLEDPRSDSPLPFVTAVFLGVSLHLRALIFIYKMSLLCY